MCADLIYEEKLSSNKTTLLFIGLVVVFGLLFFWRNRINNLDTLAIILLILCLLFLFYVINYRTLHIQITNDYLLLKFGIFRWRISNQTMDNCQLDDVSGLMKYGGAGIHFMFVNKRYRASFNFLEHPRVVISFTKKVGPVSDLSFSTKDPETIIQLVHSELNDWK